MARDSVIIAGAVCILVGAWQVYPPSAWILGGSFMFIGGILSVAYDERKKRGPR